MIFDLETGVRTGLYPQTQQGELTALPQPCSCINGRPPGSPGARSNRNPPMEKVWQQACESLNWSELCNNQHSALSQ